MTNDNEQSKKKLNQWPPVGHPILKNYSEEFNCAELSVFKDYLRAVDTVAQAEAALEKSLKNKLKDKVDK